MDVYRLRTRRQVGLVVTHSAADANGLRVRLPGCPSTLFSDLILGPLLWQASSVNYALYGCNKL